MVQLLWRCRVRAPQRIRQNHCVSWQFTPGCTSQRTESWGSRTQTGICTSTVLAVYSQPQKGEAMRRVCVRYAPGGKSFSLWEEILARAPRRVSLEDTTLREPSGTDAHVLHAPRRDGQ